MPRQRRARQPSKPAGPAESNDDAGTAGEKRSAGADVNPFAGRAQKGEKGTAEAMASAAKQQGPRRTTALQCGDGGVHEDGGKRKNVLAKVLSLAAKAQAVGVGGVVDVV